MKFVDKGYVHVHVPKKSTKNELINTNFNWLNSVKVFELEIQMTLTLRTVHEKNPNDMCMLIFRSILHTP